MVICTDWPGERKPPPGLKLVSAFLLLAYQPIVFLAVALSESVAMHWKWSFAEAQFAGRKLPGLRPKTPAVMGGAGVGVGVKVGVGVGVGVGLDLTR